MLDTSIQIPGLEMANPAKNHIAKALPHPAGGWVAQFAFPGVVPLLVSERGAPVVYRNENAAYFSALDALFKAMNNRHKNRSKTPPERYTKMTGDELAVAVADANLTPTFLGYLIGWSQEGVLERFDGARDVPHPVRLLVEIFKAIPEAVDIAESVTESVTTERRPPRREPDTAA